jgi:methylmalonyl-CoA mutase N-terminal domain/subunit
VPIKLGRDTPLEEQIATAERREGEIREFKQIRDNDKTRNALEFLRTEAKKGERHNIIPAIKDALKADATMGEILGVIRLAYGVSYDPLNVIQYPFG